MNQTIWKFNLRVDDVQKIAMPKEAKILTVQIQGELPCIWALVDPRNLDTNRIIQIAGTGHDLSKRIMGDYIGTFKYDGFLVFHVFDGGEE